MTPTIPPLQKMLQQNIPGRHGLDCQCLSADDDLQESEGVPFPPMGLESYKPHGRGVPERAQLCGVIAPSTGGSVHTTKIAWGVTMKNSNLSRTIPLAVSIAQTLLAGCASFSETRSLAIAPNPGESKVVVTSNARAKCGDVFGIIKCKLQIDLQQSGGSISGQSSATPSAGTQEDSPIQRVSISTDASKRLEQLNDLKRKGLISESEYQQKRQEILRGL